MAKPPKGAILVGSLPDELRQLMSAVVDSKHTLESMAVDLVYPDDDAHLKELKKEFAKAVVTHETLDAVFTYELKAHFDLFDKSEVGVYEGWQVYCAKECGCPACRMKAELMALGGRGMTGRGRGFIGMLEDLGCGLGDLHSEHVGSGEDPGDELDEGRNE